MKKLGFVGTRQRAPGTQYGWKPPKHKPRRPSAPPPPPDPLALQRKIAEAVTLADVAADLAQRDQAVANATFAATVQMLRDTNQLTAGQRLIRTIVEFDENGEPVGSRQEYQT